MSAVTVENKKTAGEEWVLKNPFRAIKKGYSGAKELRDLAGKDFWRSQGCGLPDCCSDDFFVNGKWERLNFNSWLVRREPDGDLEIFGDQEFKDLFARPTPAKDRSKGLAALRNAQSSLAGLRRTASEWADEKDLSAARLGDYIIAGKADKDAENRRLDLFSEVGDYRELIAIVKLVEDDLVGIANALRD